MALARSYIYCENETAEAYGKKMQLATDEQRQSVTKSDLLLTLLDAVRVPRTTRLLPLFEQLADIDYAAPQFDATRNVEVLMHTSYANPEFTASLADLSNKQSQLAVEHAAELSDVRPEHEARTTIYPKLDPSDWRYRLQLIYEASGNSAAVMANLDRALTSLLSKLEFSFATFDMLLLATRPMNESVATLTSDWYADAAAELWQSAAPLCTAVSELFSAETLAAGAPRVVELIGEIEAHIERAYGAVRARVKRSAELADAATAIGAVPEDAQGVDNDDSDLLETAKWQRLTITSMLSACSAHMSRTATTIFGGTHGGPHTNSAGDELPPVSRGASPGRGGVRRRRGESDDRRLNDAVTRAVAEAVPRAVAEAVPRAVMAATAMTRAEYVYTTAQQTFYAAIYWIAAMRANTTWFQDRQSEANALVLPIIAVIRLKDEGIGSRLLSAYQYVTWAIIGTDFARPYWDQLLIDARGWLLSQLTKWQVSIVTAGLSQLFTLWTFAPFLGLVLRILWLRFDLPGSADTIMYVADFPGTVMWLLLRFGKWAAVKTYEYARAYPTRRAAVESRELSRLPDLSRLAPRAIDFTQYRPLIGMPGGMQQSPFDELAARGITIGRRRTARGESPPGERLRVVDELSPFAELEAQGVRLRRQPRDTARGRSPPPPATRSYDPPEEAAAVGERRSERQRRALFGGS